MEKIPYKPGDVLVGKFGDNRKVIDLSKDGYLVFLSEIDNLDKVDKKVIFATQKELIQCGFTLKTPKEEHHCPKIYSNLISFKEGSGKLILPTTPWRPKNGERYFYLEIDGGIIEMEYGDRKNSPLRRKIDNWLIKSGNCFRTREEAEEKYKEIMERGI